jgi:phosphohistidine phosphatase SixA
MYFARLKPAFALLTCLLLSITACDGPAKNSADKNLKVVIIRHGEKPADKSDGGDNLSCQGQNRALQLANLLFQKIGKPDYTYVPALKLDKNTAHSRMFQTVTPFAVKYNLTINSKYSEADYADISKSVMKKSGTVLMVWSHSEMAELASALGVNNPPKWEDSDFDSMWMVTYANGKAELSVGEEGLNPSTNCSY